MDWRYRDTVLALAVVANFSQLGARLLISPVVPDVIETFAVSKGAVGLALTGMWGVYALLQFPSGVLGDRFGERRFILVALAATGLGSLLLSASPSFLLFGVFAVVLGAGTGLYFSVAASLLAKLFDDTGQALSFHTAGGSLAGLVAPVAAAFVGVRFGWRAALALGAAVALPAAVLVWLWVRPNPPDNPDRSARERLDLAVVVEVLSRPSVAFTALVSVVTVFVWQSFASFFPTFLIEHWSFTTRQAGVAFGAVFFLSTVVQPAMGRLSDARDRDAVLALTFATTAVGFGLLLVPAALPAAVLGVVLLGTGISWPGVLHARFMDCFADHERGTGFGLVRTVFMFLGAFGSVVTGVLADAAGWTAAYGLVAGLLGVALALLAVNRAFRLGL